jgi:hypothetical protein
MRSSSAASDFHAQSVETPTSGVRLDIADEIFASGFEE